MESLSNSTSGGLTSLRNGKETALNKNHTSSKIRRIFEQWLDTEAYLGFSDFGATLGSYNPEANKS